MVINAAVIVVVSVVVYGGIGWMGWNMYQNYTDPKPEVPSLGAHVASPSQFCVKCECSAKTYGNKASAGALDSRRGKHLNERKSGPTAA
jgi:hypothetical protein